ncbi:ADP-ribose pyrophosphatase YjhB (NUDIX family) [Kribbella jejuensis]|uniref:ADP-ribose pyrophosphatase YjhB (NUDIX family) n=1 Tax=Kribbella jejuensis TaxID=236068 RepID=A0A542EPF5_9ACTN|nr:ADP-ribose pyrophosphatase YjhB (NUDIX family) [Kribbella jejuensis]
MLRTFSRAQRSQYSSLRPSSMDVIQVSGTSSDSACRPHNAQVALTCPSVPCVRWTVHGEGEVWGNQWLSVRRLDVEQPDGLRFDYHAVRLKDIAAAVVTRDEHVLLMWRHRFLTDTWAWELPMGIIEPGESPQTAAARELLEETGWQADRLTELIRSEPAAGIMDSRHFVYRATAARWVGEPTEKNESDRIEWIPIADLPGMIARHEIVSGITLIGLLQLLVQS